MKSNNSTQGLFIKTQDFETANELLKCGFQLIDRSDNTWTFVNSKDKTFSFDNKKIIFSNLLNF